jgi:anti-anti-sigma regulatory factor
VLRITSRGRDSHRSFKLEGSLSGLWVNELRKAWAAAPESLQNPEVTLDLSGVSFIDEAGRDLLVEIRRTGAVLLGASPFIRELLEGNRGEKQS